MTKRSLRDGVYEPCPIRGIIDRIGDQWSMLILWSLAQRTLRFSELKREIGDISQRMLSQTLRRLEQDGLVARTVFPTVPLRVDYALTSLGRSFMTPLDTLIAWADEHHAEVRKAREEYGAERPSPPPTKALEAGSSRG